MSSDTFLNEMRHAASALPPTDTLRLILDELLAAEHNNNVVFQQSGGAAFCTTLFKNVNGAPAVWGAYVSHKPHNVPSFVHELTHAMCLFTYNADLVNYAVVPPNAVARTYNAGAPPGSPPGAFTCDNEGPRRQGWYRDECEQFLTLNLNNLEKWADATDFQTTNPWADPNVVREMQRLLALTVPTQADLDKLGRLQAENKLYGVQLQDAKAKARKQQLVQEAQRKKGFIKDRISYGRIGMSGLGDVHFEYDTVVNQMLYQMYLWGFRPPGSVTTTRRALAKQAKGRTITPQIFYTRLALVAREAHDRRAAARMIADGQAPAITAPETFINAL